VRKWIGRGEEDLQWNYSLEYSRWDCFLGDSSCVKRMVCNIEKQGGKYGSKSYLYTCDGIWLGVSQCI
jgi:hypothetical protein